MGRQAADREDARLHRILFAEQAHCLCAIDDAPTERAGRLESHEHEGAFGPRDVVAQVVPDAPAFAHAARRDDHGAGAHRVDLHGIGEVFGEVDARPALAFEVPVGMACRDLRGGERHGRIDVQVVHRHASLAAKVGDEMQHFLGAPHGEGRDHHVALAAAQGVVQRIGKLVHGLRQALVLAIAVGRLHQQHVGLRDRRRIAHDRPSGLPQVPGEDELLLAQENLDDGRAEDMARVAKPAAHRRVRLHLRVVRHGNEMHEARLRLLLRIERRVAFPLGFLLLKVAAVAQHHLGEVAGRRGGVDRAAETLRHQARNEPRMVDVRVRKQHERDVARLESERAVLGVRARSLEHAAVDEEADLSGVDLEAGAGDLSGRPVEREAQG